MKVQDAYIIGMAIHAELMRLKMHYVSAREGQEGFNRVWQEARDKVMRLVDEGNIDLIDIEAVRKEMDWLIYDTPVG